MPNSKRKILMITPYIPRLGQSGGQRHSFYTVKYLSQKNDITLICISLDNAGLEEIKQFCHKVIVIKRDKTWNLKNIIAPAFSPYPFLFIKYMSRLLSQTIRYELDHDHFDLIHCDCLYPMPNIPKTNIPIVLVDVTIEYAIYQHLIDSLPGWRKLLYPIMAIDVLKLKYWETYYWKHTRTVVMFSSDDQKFVSQMTGRHDIKFFQDGVDPRYFELPPKTTKSPNPTILLGVSNMKWMQNRESVEIFLNDHWDQVKKAYPACQLYIVGRYAPDYFGRFQNQDVIVTEADSEGGPKDPQYYHEYCWIQLAPMKSGGGTRNKFLEGMTFGQPVITTPEGGMGSIEIENYKQAIVCPSSEILKNISRLFDDQKYRLQMGADARELIKNNYSFDKCVDGLNQIYDHLIKK